MYFGDIYVGSPAQLMKVVYDTGSDWLVIETKECKNCLSNKYDPKLSSTHSRVDNDYVEHIYGSAHLYGYDAKDDVYLDKDKTVGV
jgi:hypothetical protein